MQVVVVVVVGAVGPRLGALLVLALVGRADHGGRAQQLRVRGRGRCGGEGQLIHWLTKLGK